jgi:two-component system cell cycle sensor histidine kinase/response regulator CckA
MNECDPLVSRDYALLEHLHEGVVVCGPDSIVIAANGAACSFLGCSADDLVGRPVAGSDCRLLRVDGADLAPEDHPVNVARSTAAAVTAVAVGVSRGDGLGTAWGVMSAHPEYAGDGRLERVVATIVESGAASEDQRSLFNTDRGLAAVFLASPVAIAAFRVSDQIIVDVNDAFLHTFGHTRADVIGRLTAEIEPFADAADRTRLVRELATRGKLENVEVKYRTRSGTPGVALTSMELVEFAGDLCVIAFMSDITDRKKVEAELRFRETLLEETGRIAKVGGWRFDAATGAGFWTDEVARIHDVDPAGPISRVDYYVGESRGRIAAAVEAAVNHGVPYDLELEIETAAGARKWVRTLGRPVMQDGRVVSVFGSLQDITEARGAQEALRQSEARFRAILESAPDGIYLHSESRITYLNPAMARMLHAGSPADLVGADFTSLICPEYREIVRERVRLTDETGGPLPPMEEQYRRVDGSRVAVEVTAVALQGLPEYTHMVFVRDISARKLAEAERENLQGQLLQSQKMESVGQLAGGIAHDFNNILMIQRGYSDMMKVAIRPGDPLAEDLAQIEACTQRATTLTKQLLAFSRKQTLQPRLLDLNLLVGKLGDMLRRVLGEEIELRTVMSPEPATVKADPGQLEQVLVNLALNARDAMDGGGTLTIEVYLDRADTLGRNVAVAITDTGCGMDEVTRTRVFEPFFTTKREGDGTGLGLSTVHGIVHQSGGQISVLSAPGEGSTFTIFLPSSDEQPAEEPSTPTIPNVGGAGELVLVVEDEPALRRLAVTMLEKLGYRTVGAENGGAALILVEERGLRPSLILTDVVMPGMRGGVLVDRLRKTVPDTKVVYMSGYTGDTVVAEYLDNPDVRFLQKPFSMFSLSAVVKDALERD